MKTPQKLTALVLAGVLASSSIAAVPASAKTFTDVPSNHWAYQVVDKISNEGIMVGVGNDLFAPNSTLTRAEYTAILCNLSPDKSNGLNYAAHLNDVPANAWYAEAAEWGVTHGIIKEIDGDFKPDAVVSRELMADMTYKFLYYELYGAIEEDATSVGYADADQISPDYKKSVNILSNNGLLAGRGGNQFVPQGTLTRAEAAAMASRLIEVIDAFEAENPGDNPSEKPEQPVDPDNPAEEPAQPIEPETPAEDPSEPAEDPSSWDLDGAPKWFLVGKPDSFTADQWNELIDYWEDKESEAHSSTGYPVELPSYCKTEAQAKDYMEKYITSLYTRMTTEKSIQQIFESNPGNISISSEQENMINMINSEREKNGREPLILSPALCQAAAIRAKEAANLARGLNNEQIYNLGADYFHSRDGQRKAITVLSDIGFGEYMSIASGGTGKSDKIKFGENLTLRTYEKTYTSNEAFSSLMNSSAHRKNMLSPNYEYVGVAYYSTGSNSAWIQIFARTQ